MRIPEFTLERYFAAHEFKARYLLSASDCESMSLDELLALASDEGRRLWHELWLGYTESPGHPLLRGAIAAGYEHVTPDEVLVAVPEEAIFLAMNALLAAGDHVIVCSPAYQSLQTVPEALGCRVSRWEIHATETGWAVAIDELTRQITPATRLLVINFPHNPTGFLPSRGEMDAIVALVARHGLYLFSDEMYRLLEYDTSHRLPAAVDLYDRAISLTGLSKAYGLPGLRIGWLACRDRAVLTALTRLKDYTTICNSAPSEVLALIGLAAADRILARNLTLVRHNCALAQAFCAAHGDRFRWLAPEAGSVAFPELLGPQPVTDFCETLLARCGVMAVPGIMFGHTGNHFRLGLGRVSFAQALALVEQAL